MSKSKPKVIEKDVVEANDNQEPIQVKVRKPRSSPTPKPVFILYRMNPEGNDIELIDITRDSEKVLNLVLDTTPEVGNSIKLQKMDVIL